MKLQYIALDRLCVSKVNMRWSRKTPDVSDLLPTIRKRGVLQPVIVRPCATRTVDTTDSDAPDYEIVAGSRRFHAARQIAEERRAAGETDPECAALPCAILDEGDDADALEASLIENAARRDPSEIVQWDSFTRLVKEGRTVEDIALTFGMPDLAVRRVLALGNLLPRIRSLYDREDIDRITVRHLTLASKSQQRAWLALYGDPDAYAPTGHQLKAWLFGGQSIPVRHALFDVEASGLGVVADLFGEDAYFADADAFLGSGPPSVFLGCRRCSAMIQAGRCADPKSWRRPAWIIAAPASKRQGSDTGQRRLVRFVAVCPRRPAGAARSIALRAGGVG